MSACKEIALEYQKLMAPFAEKAERDAEEIIKALEIEIPKVYQLIPKKGLKNKVRRFIYRVIEEEV